MRNVKYVVTAIMLTLAASVAVGCRKETTPPAQPKSQQPATAAATSSPSPAADAQPTEQDVTSEGVLVSLEFRNEFSLADINLWQWRLTIPPGYKAKFYDRFYGNGKFDPDRSICHEQIIPANQLAQFNVGRGYEKLENNKKKTLRLFYSGVLMPIDPEALGISVANLPSSHDIYKEPMKFRIKPGAEFFFANFAIGISSPEGEVQNNPARKPAVEVRCSFTVEPVANGDPTDFTRGIHTAAPEQVNKGLETIPLPAKTPANTGDRPTGIPPTKP